MMLAATLAIIAVASNNGVAAFSSPASITCRPSTLPSSMAVQTSSWMVGTRSNRVEKETLQILYSTNEEDDGDNEASSDSNQKDKDQAPEETEAEVVTSSLTPSQIQSLKSQRNSLLTTIKQFFKSKTKFNRESLGKLGVSALLAYGFVSNVSGVLAVSSAWFIFSKRTGLSPMSPGQKPAFLAVYAGFTVLLNVIRPARFAFAMAISPYFERIRKFFQRKFGVSPRGAAVLMVIFINLVGTCSLMAAGVGLASVLSGVPVWAGR